MVDKGFASIHEIQTSYPPKDIKGVDLDSAGDYTPLRRTMFDFEFAPLPQILQLPEPDQALNRRGQNNLNHDVDLEFWSDS
jgi:hypothetical protein